MIRTTPTPSNTNVPIASHVNGVVSLVSAAPPRKEVAIAAADKSKPARVLKASITTRCSSRARTPSVYASS